MDQQQTLPAPTEAAPVPEPKPPVWETFQLKPIPIQKEEFPPHNFQQFAVYKSLAQKIFIFGLATGLGKTLCSFLSYFYFKFKFPKTKLLIVTTKSATLQYRKELDKFFNHSENAQAIHSQMPKMGAKSYPMARRNAYASFGDGQNPNALSVMLMNYALFRIDHKYIQDAVLKLRKQGWEVVVVFDEATNFKNIATVTHRCVHATSGAATKVVGLTATLTKGRLEEIYAIYRGLGYQLARNKDEFMDKYCIVFSHPKRKHIKNVVGYKNVNEFVELIKPLSVVLRKADVAKYLPSYTQRVLEVEHSEEQFQLIRDIYSGIVAVDGDGEPDLQAEMNNLLAQQDAQHEGGEFNPFAGTTEADKSNLATGAEDPSKPKFQMIQSLTETGFIKRVLLDPRLLTRKDLDNHKLHSPKTAEIIRLLQDEFTDEKVVIYTPSKQYLKLLKSSIGGCEDVPEKYRTVLEISGDISGQGREQAKDLFCGDPNHNVIIINDAGTEAINLQAASVLIVTSLPKSGGDLVQLAGRLSRLGSKHSQLYIMYLVTKDSQDEDERLIIQQQLQIMAAVLGEAEKGLIDWELLKEHGNSESVGDTLTGPDGKEEKADISRQSLAKVMLHKRKKRAAHYTDKGILMDALSEMDEGDAPEGAPLQLPAGKPGGLFDLAAS